MFYFSGQQWKNNHKRRDEEMGKGSGERNVWQSQLECLCCVSGERISLKRLQYKDPNFSIFNRCSTRDVLQKRQEGLKISGRWLLCLWTAACQPTVLHSADDPQAWPRICQDQLSRLQHIWRPDLPLLIRESVKPAGCTWWQRFHSSIEINAILG